MGRYFLGGALLFGVAWLGWSCSDDAGADRLCDPGSNVFCRCRGTLEAGTKLCNDAGDGFGACESAFGECEEIVDDGTGGEGLDDGSGGGIDPDPGELYAPCDPDGDGPKEGTPCDEGLECLQGYCTQECETFEDCTAYGDCIAFGSNNRCAPYCLEQSDCELYDDTVGCGYTGNAVPTFDVVVCAQWGDELELPPDGFPPVGPCDADVLCNLGFAETERVCDIDGCTDGCHVTEDCSGGATCSSSGSEVGTCGGGGNETSLLWCFQDAGGTFTPSPTTGSGTFEYGLGLSGGGNVGGNAGPLACSGATRAATASNWTVGAFTIFDDAVAADTCYSFTVSTADGPVVLHFDEQRSSSGPVVFGVDVRRFAGDTPVVVATEEGTHTSFTSHPMHSIDLGGSSLANQPAAVVRICGYASVVGSGTWRVDNVRIETGVP